jgi:large subunit ribosomal protein L3
MMASSLSTMIRAAASSRLLLRSPHFSVIALRDYSSTPYLRKDDKIDSDMITDGTDEYIVKMNTDMTDEEAEKIIEEELAKFEEIAKSKEYPDWKPGERKRPLLMSYRLEDFEYELDPDRKPKWTLRDKRCGALGIKVGMMPLWDDWGERHPCTVLYLDTNTVLGHKTMEKHGYMAVQLAAGERKRKNVGKCVLHQYSQVDDLFESPPYLVREFRVSDEQWLLPVGSNIHARHFVPGQNVDISGISKGKGFQGGMKRHGFAGQPASHGNSKAHRAIGSTGACQDPGKVWKGKKMPGRMGNDRVTMQNLPVVKIDRGRNLLYIRGAIPGNKGEFVEIKDAVKKPLWNTEKVMGHVDRPPLPTFEYEEVDGCGEAGHELFMPLGKQDPFGDDDESAA